MKLIHHGKHHGKTQEGARSNRGPSGCQVGPAGSTIAPAGTPPLGFWPPLVEASTTTSPYVSRPLVKSV